MGGVGKSSVPQTSRFSLIVTGFGADRASMDQQSVDAPVPVIPEHLREDLLELVSAAAGSVWAREGLSAASRSMITISILTTLGRSDELRQHVRLGVEQFGLSPADIGEIILHSSIYAGFPAALEAFRVANEELGLELLAPQAS